MSGLLSGFRRKDDPHDMLRMAYQRFKGSLTIRLQHPQSNARRKKRRSNPDRRPADVGSSRRAVAKTARTKPICEPIRRRRRPKSCQTKPNSRTTWFDATRFTSGDSGRGTVSSALVSWRERTQRRAGRPERGGGDAGSSTSGRGGPSPASAGGCTTPSPSGPGRHDGRAFSLPAVHGEARHFSRRRPGRRRPTPRWRPRARSRRRSNAWWRPPAPRRGR